MRARTSKLNDQSQERDILDQMAALVSSTEGYASIKAKNRTGACLAVARLFPGMSIASWDKLNREHDLSGWLAFPLDNGACGRFSERRYGLPLFDRGHFEKMADAEINSAVDLGISVSLAVLECSCPDPAEADDAAWAVYDALRPNELLGRISAVRLAVLLPGLGLNSAKMRLEALKDHLSQTFTGGPFLRAGLTCCAGRVKGTAAELIELTEKGLDGDAGQGGKWIIVCEFAREKAAVKATMVHSDEKRFLFAGGI